MVSHWATQPQQITYCGEMVSHWATQPQQITYCGEMVSHWATQPQQITYCGEMVSHWAAQRTHHWCQQKLPNYWDAAASCARCSDHCGNTAGVASAFPVPETMAVLLCPLRLQPLNRDRHHRPHFLGTATLVPPAVHCLVIQTHLPGQLCLFSVLQKESDVSMTFTHKRRALMFTS
jgi:hypothetical protein